MTTLKEHANFKILSTLHSYQEHVGFSSISKPTKHNTIDKTFKVFKCGNIISSMPSLAKSIQQYQVNVFKSF